jgi:uncharacterized repeat protein (TIGR01451 family)
LATGTLDQSNPGPATFGAAFIGASDAVAAQTFTAGLTGSLDTVDLNVYRQDSNVTQDLVVKILGADTLVDPAGTPDAGNVLATQTVPLSNVSTDPTNVQRVVFDAPPQVQAGMHYAIVAQMAAAGPSPYLWGLTHDTYGGGQVCQAHTAAGSYDPWICQASQDFIFSSYVTTPPALPSADVAVGVGGPTAAAKGAQVTYTVTVSNAGPSTAHNVVLNDPVPSGTSFVAVSATHGTCAGPSAKKTTISCSLGDLASGGNVGGTVAVKIAAKVGSTVANLVSAYSTADNAGPATADPNTANNFVSVSTTVTK